MGRDVQFLLKALIIVAAGMAVRFALLSVVDPLAALHYGDSAYYAADAQRLLATGRPTPGHPILYQIFLALVPWPLVAQSALTIASGVLAYLRFRGRVGFWTGITIATCPFLAIFDFKLLTESLYINLVWCAWLALGWNGIAAGALLGLALLTRDTLLLLPAFAALLLRTKRAAVMGALAYVVALPWLLYPSDSSRFGLTLWIGTWERDMAWQAHGMDKPEFPAAAHVTADERRAYPNDGPALKRAAIARMRANPGEVLSVWADRYPQLWIGSRMTIVPARPRINQGAILVAGFFLNLLLLAFGLWGLRRAKEFAIPVAYAALVYIPFHNAETRYSLFAVPFLIYAGALIVTRSTRPRRADGRQSTFRLWSRRLGPSDRACPSPTGRRAREGRA